MKMSKRACMNCPVCNINLPTEKISSHVNGHFEEGVAGVHEFFYFIQPKDSDKCQHNIVYY